MLRLGSGAQMIEQRAGEEVRVRAGCRRQVWTERGRDRQRARRVAEPEQHGNGRTRMAPGAYAAGCVHHAGADLLAMTSVRARGAFGRLQGGWYQNTNASQRCSVPRLVDRSICYKRRSKPIFWPAGRTKRPVSAPTPLSARISIPRWLKASNRPPPDPPPQ